MSRLSGDLVRHKLATRVFGQNVVYTEQTGSTNTDLKALAQKGAPEGMLYLTDKQVAGRGRLEGRRWFAPAESSLLLSLLFRPAEVIPPHQAQQLTMICALAMSNAIERQTGLRPILKWPNDLIWHDGKKLAGILTELDVEKERLNWVVVGIGLNVNLDFRQYPKGRKATGGSGNGGPPLSHTAISLSMILGRDTNADRLPILQRFLENLERRYEALQQGARFHQEWSGRLVGIGQPVTVSGPQTSKKGIMVGVDESGALLLEQEDGSIETILAGDVTIHW
jgi:BirA family biotin operon repressor/biotin-[acetyl-CoA-carboxylase] ligase